MQLPQHCKAKLEEGRHYVICPCPQDETDLKIMAPELLSNRLPDGANIVVATGERSYEHSGASLEQLIDNRSQRGAAPSFNTTRSAYHNPLRPTRKQDADGSDNEFEDETDRRDDPANVTKSVEKQASDTAKVQESAEAAELRKLEEANKTGSLDNVSIGGMS